MQDMQKKIWWLFGRHIVFIITSAVTEDEENSSNKSKTIVHLKNSDKNEQFI